MDDAPVSLFSKEYGQKGHPLIILHGLLGASGNWHTLSRKAFSEHFHVFTVDQRNHGRSPHRDRFSYPAMAEDLWLFMREHDLGTTHLMGHSMGGKTAMYAALGFPERIDKLIVVDMAPTTYPPHHEYLFEGLKSLELDRYENRRDIDEALAEYVDSYRVRQFLLKNLDYDGDRYAWKMNLDVIHANYERVVKGLDTDRTYDGPTLFIRGEESDYIADDDVPAIRKNFPNAELVTIPDAGHWVHADAPDAFADAVLDFLL